MPRVRDERHGPLQACEVLRFVRLRPAGLRPGERGAGQALPRCAGLVVRDVVGIGDVVRWVHRFVAMVTTSGADAELVDAQRPDEEPVHVG